MSASTRNTIINDIDAELKKILNNCQIFADEFCKEQDENYGFLVTIGSNIGNIEKKLKELRV